MRQISILLHYAKIEFFIKVITDNEKTNKIPPKHCDKWLGRRANQSHDSLLAKYKAPDSRNLLCSGA